METRIKSREAQMVPVRRRWFGDMSGWKKLGYGLGGLAVLGLGAKMWDGSKIAITVRDKGSGEQTEFVVKLFTNWRTVWAKIREWLGSDFTAQVNGLDIDNANNANKHVMDVLLTLTKKDKSFFGKRHFTMEVKKKPVEPYYVLIVRPGGTITDQFSNLGTLETDEEGNKMLKTTATLQKIQHAYFKKFPRHVGKLETKARLLQEMGEPVLIQQAPRNGGHVLVTFSIIPGTQEEDS